MLVWLESFILFGSGLKHSSRFVYITFKIDLVNIQPCFVYIRSYPAKHQVSLTIVNNRECKIMIEQIVSIPIGSSSNVYCIVKPFL